MFGETMKKVPADAITTATCIASEGVKTLIRVGKGELSLDEGREKMAETVCVAAGAYVGKKAGEKAGRCLGKAVGSLFGPVGATVGSAIGSKVGAFVGHKVGKVVGKVVYKVGQAYRKARDWVREKIGGGLRKFGRAIGRCFRALKFW
jgi:phage tail tape-measure protein